MPDLPTLEDVARLSNTSRSTVSRVINNQPGVHEKTRKKVLAAIETLKFQPNPHARRLVTGENSTIGCVVPSKVTRLSSDAFFAPVMDGICRVAYGSGYSVILWIVESQSDSELLLQNFTQSRQIDGVILIPAPENEALYAGLVQNQIPCVTIGHFFHQREYFVDIDNVASAQLAVDHLLALGYKRIGTITGRQFDTGGYERLMGYKQALQAAGYAIDPELIIDGEYEEHYAHARVGQLIQAGCDAIFSANDSMAIGVIRALRAAGLRVPQDVAIVGFDDVPRAAMIEPALTTVRQPLYEFGSVAARFLLDLMRNPDQIIERQMMLDTELVIRESCGYRQQHTMRASVPVS